MNFLNYYYCAPCNYNWSQYDYSNSSDSCPCCGSPIYPHDYQYFGNDDDD